MHRAIGYISKRFVQIRPGEGRKVLLTFLYFFLAIASYYVVKPVSRALVLGDLGSRLLPLGDLVTAILMGPMVGLFAMCVDRMDKRHLVGGAYAMIIASFLAFRALLAWDNRWVSAALYVWVAIFSVLIVTMFWLVANDLYHPREAKRLFGFIGSGGMLGGIVGSSVAAVGAKFLGTDNLLLISTGLLVGCWLIVERLWRFSLHTAPRPTGHTRAQGTMSWARLAQELRRSRYLLLLVGLVCIGKIMSTWVDYQLNPFLETHFPDQDTRTAFLGLFFGWINVASFVVQFFFTSWVLRRLGLVSALLALPLGLLGMTAGLLVVPSFWLAAGAELYDRSMNYSLQQTSKEVLYLPIDRSIRYKVKPFIDMVVFRFGKGLAAAVGLVVMNMLGLPARVLLYPMIPLLLAWIVLTVWLRHDYIVTIRGLLRMRAGSRDAPREGASTWVPQTADGPQQPQLDAWLTSLSPHWHSSMKLRLVGELLGANPSLDGDGKRLLEALTFYEQTTIGSPAWRPAATRERLVDRLSDRHAPMAARRQALAQLVDLGEQETVDCLLGLLMVEEDAAIRYELIYGLTTLRLRDTGRLEFSKRIVRRQLAKQVEVYQRIGRVMAVYGWSKPTAASENDAIVRLLRVLLTESTEQMFQLLGLIYRPEDIYLIHHQVRQPDAYIRADAIELLDNLLDPALRWLIFPMLDEDQFLGHVGEAADEQAFDAKSASRLLQQTATDQHRWLSVAVICLAGHIGLDPLLDELDRGAELQPPLVNLSAKVARGLVSASPIGSPP